ncbi:MAG TPA: hypothetical protein VGQ58_04010 [Candidatus Limnocylindrales bacterium]|jgi:hypothetical protein|nr:hypothetical protein [Candidatus Limnocylindrales bacterium]
MQRRRGLVVPVIIAAIVGSAAALVPAGPSSRAAAAHQPPLGAHGSASPAAARPFRVDLADRNDFVAQTNFVQCVGASMQMMLNVMGASDRTARTQARLQVLARSLSGPTREGFQRHGASVRGWTAGLNQLGAGPYRMVGASSLEEALQLAARAIRTTGRPVGLLVWAGRHAWVMSGFEATADPATTANFRVTRAIVLDPLYPYGSGRWGASPAPRQAITPATLGKQFVPRRKGTWAGALPGGAGGSLSALAGKWVIVMPYRLVPIARHALLPS